MVRRPITRESVMGEMGRLFREHMVLRGFAEATSTR